MNVNLIDFYVSDHKAIVYNVPLSPPTGLVPVFLMLILPVNSVKLSPISSNPNPNHFHTDFLHLLLTFKAPNYVKDLLTHHVSGRLTGGACWSFSKPSWWLRAIKLLQSRPPSSGMTYRLRSFAHFITAFKSLLKTFLEKKLFVFYLILSIYIVLVYFIVLL